MNDARSIVRRPRRNPLYGNVKARWARLIAEAERAENAALNAVASPVDPPTLRLDPAGLVAPPPNHLAMQPDETTVSTFIPRES
jgi:hypothetical protein